MLWAWVSLFWVGFTDLYVRLCAMGIWTIGELFEALKESPEIIRKIFHLDQNDNELLNASTLQRFISLTLDDFHA